ncbi:hypothetical protein AXG93_3309s1190 [Marchantia polymorpha subsp. ruderalis]|uniref:Uncharacterized protein n=1 Tax=Marchantia polymorpha subsp. ruderalis TaxID=1480154 RepID=A0A176W606_MARPO|nr:hypothetical protein AXG93_3309s1190 [Marchantia polymorpha subsp. ruderalis]
MARTEAHTKDMQRPNELMASLTEKTKKHEAKLASWATKLTKCETAKYSEVECRLKFDADCDRLQDQLKTVEEQLESRTRAEAEELAFRQLKKETTNSFCLRVEKCLRGFEEWKIQMLKWMKLDLLERRLMGLKISGTIRHCQLGANGSLEDAVTVASDDFAFEYSSLRAVELFRNLE